MLLLWLWFSVIILLNESISTRVSQHVTLVGAVYITIDLVFAMCYPLLLCFVHFLKTIFIPVYYYI